MPSVSDFAVESDVWPHIASPGQGLQGGFRLISSAKLQHADLGLQSSAIFRNLLQSFAIFCNLLTPKMGVKYSGCNGYEKSGDERFFAPHPPTFCPHARYFAAYHHERALRAIPLFPLPTSLSTHWARDTRIMRVRHARKSRQ